MYHYRTGEEMNASGLVDVVAERTVCESNSGLRPNGRCVDTSDGDFRCDCSEGFYSSSDAKSCLRKCLVIFCMHIFAVIFVTSRNMLHASTQPVCFDLASSNIFTRSTM